MPLSVLHVIGAIAKRYGGPQHNVRDVCTALASQGHRVAVLTTDRDGHERLSEAERRGLSPAISWVVVPARSPGPAMSLDFGRKAWELVGEADLVHLHGIYAPATAVAAIAAKRRGVPYVQQLHGAATHYHWSKKRWKKAPYEALIQSRIITKADAVLAMTEMEAEQASRVFPAAQMRVIHPPITVEHTGADRRRRAMELKAGRPATIGFLGRLSEKKGAPILLRAFERIAREFPTARLVIAGPDDEEIGVQVRHEADRLKLEGRVKFPGLVVGRAKTALLEEFDIFALPSADESLGIAVVEAMGAGLPVVITEQVAIANDVKAAKAGIVQTRSAEGFADAIRRLLRNPDEAARIGASGRALANGQFSRAASTDHLVQLYEEILAGSNAVGRSLGR